MEAIVLAGGLGTRLKTVVPDLPKPMAPIAGRPFLEIVFDGLAAKGVTRVVLSLGFMAEKITGHFGGSYKGLELVYVLESKPLGTGGAARLALGECRSEAVFVLNGDTYLDLEVDAVAAQRAVRGKPVIVGREVADTARYGRLQVANSCVTGFTEKGVAGPGLINAGCYLLGRHQLDAYAIGEPFSLEADYLAKAVGSMDFDLFVTQGKFIDIGVPEDFARAQIELAGV